MRRLVMAGWVNVRKEKNEKSSEAWWGRKYVRAREPLKSSRISVCTLPMFTVLPTFVAYAAPGCHEFTEMIIDMAWNNKYFQLISSTTSAWRENIHQTSLIVDDWHVAGCSSMFLQVRNNFAIHKKARYGVIINLTIPACSIVVGHSMQSYFLHSPISQLGLGCMCL